MESEKLRNLGENYNLELEKADAEIKKIRKENPKILLQFPDGLKPYAPEIFDILKEKNKKADIKIWLGSCFGACDIPSAKADLLIQFGHAKWKK